MRRPVVALLALALVVFGAGCNGDDDDGVLPEPPGPTAPVPRPLVATDFRFEPDQLEFRAGSQVTIGFSNGGAVEHNLTVAAFGVTADFKPGEGRNVIFLAPSAGRYEFLCKFHADQGMKGTLVVNP